MAEGFSASEHISKSVVLRKAQNNVIPGFDGQC